MARRQLVEKLEDDAGAEIADPFDEALASQPRSGLRGGAGSGNSAAVTLPFEIRRFLPGAAFSRFGRPSPSIAGRHQAAPRRDSRKSRGCVKTSRAVPSLTVSIRPPAISSYVRARLHPTAADQSLMRHPYFSGRRSIAAGRLASDVCSNSVHLHFGGQTFIAAAGASRAE